MHVKVLVEMVINPDELRHIEDGLNEVRFLLIWISVEHSSPGLEYLTLLRREPNNEPIDKEKEVRT